MPEAFKKLKIVFMGTPDFAVPSLETLHKHHEVTAVVTAPDKPAGRGRKLTASAVKKFAEANQLKILQPVKLKDPAFLKTLSACSADLFVVVAFRMLPEVVWSMPEKGTINLHASLLPDYRGAAPINHAIIKGEKETGLTTFFINHKIDTGDILHQKKVKILDDETAGSLHDKLMMSGAALLLQTVNEIAAGQVKTTPQSAFKKSLKTAPKIFRDDCRIKWQQKAENVDRFIRGLSPYPGAFTSLNGKSVKIYRSTVVGLESNKNPGEITAFSDELKVTCGDHYMIRVLELQSEGKQRMDVKEWLKGTNIDKNAKFI